MSELRRMLEAAPPGTSFTREGLLAWLQKAPQEADGPEVVSTVQAARILGYSPKRWRAWCQEGHIEGAYQDGERWRFPLRAARAYLARRANRNTRRGRRGPNKAQTTPPARARPATGTEGPVLDGRPAAIRRPTLHRTP